MVLLWCCCDVVMLCSFDCLVCFARAWFVFNAWFLCCLMPMCVCCCFCLCRVLDCVNVCLRVCVFVCLGVAFGYVSCGFVFDYVFACVCVNYLSS